MSTTELYHKNDAHGNATRVTYYVPMSNAPTLSLLNLPGFLPCGECGRDYNAADAYYETGSSACPWCGGGR